MTTKSINQQNARRFIRHPSSMPIQFDLCGDVPPRCEQLRNVSKGGLCFASRVPLSPGEQIHLRINVADQLFEANALVTWCGTAESGYEAGVRFLDEDDVFRMRMVEQLCYIEEYRQSVAREQGRELSSEDAAAEWIALFASEFPRFS